MENNKQNKSSMYTGDENWDKHQSQQYNKQYNRNQQHENQGNHYNLLHENYGGQQNHHMMDRDRNRRREEGGNFMENLGRGFNRGHGVYGDGNDDNLYEGNNPNRQGYGMSDSNYGGMYGTSNLGGNYNYGNANYGSQQNRNQDRDWFDRTRDKVASWFGDDDAQRRSGDNTTSGKHRGKGPKGYKRSDERIKDDVCDRLADDGYVDASNIDVEVRDCEVVLTGTVESREAKRRAEDVVESISGVQNVQNQLRVARGENNY